MRKILTIILGMLGLNALSACMSSNFENQEVGTFAELVKQKDVILVDVRTAEE